MATKKQPPENDALSFMCNSAREILSGRLNSAKANFPECGLSVNVFTMKPAGVRVELRPIAKNS